MQGYLDFNATAPLRETSKKAMEAAMHVVGNPSSVHKQGREVRRLIENARVNIGYALGVEAKRIVFTSGATESNNLALKRFPGRVLISAGEHDSVFRVREDAIIVPLLKNGVVDLGRLEKLLKDGSEIPTLVSVIAAQNETGAIQPLADIIRLARENKAYIHSDAVQALGKVELPWNLLDMVSLSAHKVGGPAGVGLLVINPALPMFPLMMGGGQERSYRAGTENLIGICGMAAAIEDCLQEDWLNIAARRDYLENSIQMLCVDAVVLCKESTRLPNTSLLTMPGVKSEVQVMNFDLAGFAVSSGSACSSGKTKRSRILEAMQVPVEQNECALRISMGLNSSLETVTAFVKAWQTIWDRCGLGRSLPRERLRIENNMRRENVPQHVA